MQGHSMAEISPPAGGHPDMDYAEHEKTSHLFLGLAKWGSIGVLLILVLLAMTTL